MQNLECTFIFLKTTYVVGTQKNLLNEPAPLITQDILHEHIVGAQRKCLNETFPFST